MLALFDSPLARRVRSGGSPHAPLVVAHSAAAPAGRGPESPLAKFLIGASLWHHLCARARRTRMRSHAHTHTHARTHTHAPTHTHTHALTHART